MKPSTAQDDLGELFGSETQSGKYHSQNWIAHRLVTRFLRQVLSVVRVAGNPDIHEVGCGEGQILGVLAQHGFDVRGSDIDTSALAVAEREAIARGLSIALTERSLFELDPAQDGASTVVCCEVLEHLDDPEAALRKLISLTRKDLILSVPREPLWRVLNCVRGKYLLAWGNTPGHTQHWSARSFTAFVGRHAEIVSIQTPTPWVLVHCRMGHR